MFSKYQNKITRTLSIFIKTALFITLFTSIAFINHVSVKAMTIAGQGSFQTINRQGVIYTFDASFSNVSIEVQGGGMSGATQIKVSCNGKSSTFNASTYKTTLSAGTVSNGTQVVIDVNGAAQVRINSITGDCKHSSLSGWKSDGSNHWKVCNKCSATVSKGGHSWSTTTAATCTAAGSKKCSTCGKTATIAKLNHSYSTAWTTDGTYHWHKCTRSGCTSVSGKATHDSVGWTTTTAATCTTDGSKKCKTCAKTASIAKLGHSWDTAWTSDGTYHWHKCTRSGCTSVDGKATHDSVGWTTTAAATCTTDGSKKCKTCEYMATIMKDSSNHTGYADPVITWSGYEATYTQICSGCNATVASGNCTVSHTITKWPDYTDDGVRTYTASTGTVNDKSATDTKEQQIERLNGSFSVEDLDIKPHETKTAHISASPTIEGTPQTVVYLWQVYKGDEWVNAGSVTGFAGGNSSELTFNPQKYDNSISKIRCEITTNLVDPLNNSDTSQLVIYSGEAGIWVNNIVESGKFAIIKDTLIIKAEDKTKGEYTDDPELTYTLEGTLPENVNIESLGTESRPVIKCIREEGEDVGTYTITPVIDEELLADYIPYCDITITEGTLTIAYVSSYNVTVPAIISLEKIGDFTFNSESNVHVDITSHDPNYHVYVKPEDTVYMETADKKHSATLDVTMANEDFTYQTAGMERSDKTYSMDSAMQVTGDITYPDKYDGNMNFTIYSKKTDDPG